MILLIGVHRIGKFPEIESRIEVTRLGERR